MNEDFYYFFSLFKDNCVFNEALNTARYRYVLDPQRYLNLYSDIVNDPGNIHLIEDELSMFFNIDVLSHNEYVLLMILKNIIVDSRKIICGKDSDKLYEIQEINADLLYLIVKLLLQKAAEELSNFTVRCSLIENATNIDIDSKTNTRPFKKSFLHRIFTVTDTLPQNVSLLLVFVCSCQTAFPLYQLEEFFSTHRLSFFEPPALPGGSIYKKHRSAIGAER